MMVLLPRMWSHVSRDFVCLVHCCFSSSFQCKVGSESVCWKKYDEHQSTKLIRRKTHAGLILCPNLTLQREVDTDLIWDKMGLWGKSVPTLPEIIVSWHVISDGRWGWLWLHFFTVILSAFEWKVHSKEELKIASPKDPFGCQGQQSWRNTLISQHLPFGEVAHGAPGLTSPSKGSHVSMLLSV